MYCCEFYNTVTLILLEYKSFKKLLGMGQNQGSDKTKGVVLVIRRETESYLRRVISEFETV